MGAYVVMLRYTATVTQYIVAQTPAEAEKSARDAWIGSNEGPVGREVEVISIEEADVSE